MGREQVVARKIYRKEGILVKGDEKLEVRRNFRVESSLNWSDSEEIINQSLEELEFGLEYAKQLAKKRENGVIEIEVDNNGKTHQVFYQLIDTKPIIEFYLEKIV